MSANEQEQSDGVHVDNGLASGLRRLISEAMIECHSDEWLVKHILNRGLASSAQITWLNSVLRREGRRWQPDTQSA